MPLEVSPAPFAASQRLPYTPPIPRPDAGVYPSGASNSGPGPAAAASTIIPPAPGGVAGPHRAIPALPEAGYTSAHHMPPISGSNGGPPSMYGASQYNTFAPPPRSVYDIDHYEPHHYQSHFQPPLSVVQSDNWATSSLPAPRRGPVYTESSIAPHDHSQHHHHLQHRHRHLDEDYDARSDASYYAMPKNGRRSRSTSVSSMSEAEGLDEATPHRSRSIAQHDQVYRHPRSSSLSPAHGRTHHASMLPSPLAARVEGGAGGLVGRSPLSSLGPAENARRVSPAPEEEHRHRHQSYLPSDDERHHGSSQQRDPEKKGDERLHHHPHHQHQTLSSPEPEGHSRPQIRRHNSARMPSRHANQGHIRQHSGSHLQPEFGRPHWPPPGLGGPASADGLAQPFPGDIGESDYRRRAVSMHGMERPPYQSPGVTRGTSMFDDGGSVVSDSNMTFMDGMVDGRASQYGLPMYPHQPKKDYRRYCVQRGNADVFLD